MRQIHHSNEFSKQAKHYQDYNIIQKKVAKRLIQGINSKPKKILDLGCGNGAVYSLISWNIIKFVGVDKASKLLSLHPKNRYIETINGDFEDIEFDYFDIIISSSSLQWAKDIESLLQKISKNSDEIALSIFCDGTFKTIYNRAKLKSFLPKSDSLLKILNRYFNFRFEIIEYKLHFKDNLSKFRYIKKSGVNGKGRKLSFKETKELINSYPLSYLEFEVIFIWGKPLRVSSSSPDS